MERIRGTRVDPDRAIGRRVAPWRSLRSVREPPTEAGRGRACSRNGDVWAWQAKYLFEFDSSAAGQVTSSVRRVLSQEPNLKRYLVAMPLDMPAGDTEDRSSAYTRWTDKVSEWEALADEMGLEVEFIFVGAHRLLTALTEPRHAGLVFRRFPSPTLEFGNPLFLKLTCEALATLGATRFPFGTAGLATVCDAFSRPSTSGFPTLVASRSPGSAGGGRSRPVRPG